LVRAAQPAGLGTFPPSNQRQGGAVLLEKGNELVVTRIRTLCRGKRPRRSTRMPKKRATVLSIQTEVHSVRNHPGGRREGTAKTRQKTSPQDGEGGGIAKKPQTLKKERKVAKRRDLEKTRSGDTSHRRTECERSFSRHDVLTQGQRASG